MTITRLTVTCPLLRPWLRPLLLLDIFLRLFRLQYYGVFCGFRAGAVGDYQNITGTSSKRRPEAT